MITQEIIDRWEEESILQLLEWDGYSKLGPCNVLASLPRAPQTGENQK